MKAPRNVFDIGIRFEKIISRIFGYYSFEIDSCLNSSLNAAVKLQYDILAKKYGVTYLIETKFSRGNSVSVLRLSEAASKLSAFINSTQCRSQDCVPILVVGATVTPELRRQIHEQVIVIDIQNLLFLVNNNDVLKSELLSILEFSVNDIIPLKPDTNIFEVRNDLPLQKDSEEVKSDEGNSLLNRVLDWDSACKDTKKQSSEYEKLCRDVLKYLFNDELSLWHTQQRANEDLYRFDLICKIKDGNVSGFWTTIQQIFNTKYILFEFKNYADPITQKEVYTTDKYLYLRALRGVAIIVSCKGASLNADKAIRGTLRENGKLILSVNNDELCEMIKIKMNDGTPADYLYSKLDELLVDLEK